MHIAVWADSVTPRLQYITQHILGEMLGFEVVLTENRDQFSSFAGAKIAYGDVEFDDAISISPHGLLGESGITRQAVTMGCWNSVPIFFETNPHAQIPFDLFAAAFYLISRYEEYLPFESDEHRRFPSTASLAHRESFLEIPLVDMWVKELETIIKQKFPDVAIKERSFQFIPTIDIDNAYAFKHRGLLQSCLGLGKALVHFRFADFAGRLTVFLGSRPDPFDTYHRLFQILIQCPDAVWFMLGGKRGRFDKSVPLGNQSMQALIKRIASEYRVGIHPSYASGDVLQTVREELNGLSEVVGQPITASRQHYLRFRMPHTHRLLAGLGITHEYSMGYSNAIGFRASTCTPFRFYDLMDEKELPLTIVPFQVMDRALLTMGCNAQTAAQRTLELAQRVKRVGGTFSTLWHNESLSGINEWKGWENVLGEIVNRVKAM